jgi:hypothetical protein
MPAAQAYTVGDKSPPLRITVLNAEPSALRRG